MAKPTASEIRAAEKAEQTRLLNERAIQNPGAFKSDNVLTPQRSGATVTVACKLGVAYYDIQHCRPEQVYENTQTGPREITQHKRVGLVVRLRGTAYPRGTPPEGFPEKPTIVGGAALNRGIDKDWFDAWLEQNKRNPLVMSRMIFAHENEDHVRGEAKDLSSFLSGLEPVNPKKDVRMPKSTNAAVSEVETEESRATKAAMLSES